MARNIKTSVLEALGFTKREIGECTDYVINLHRGWSIEYCEGEGFELVHEGNSVPLRCRGEEHLKALIAIL